MGHGGRQSLGLQAEGTLKQGEALDRSAETLDGVKKALGGGDPTAWLPNLGDILFGPDKFGDYGATSAFNAFSRAWNLECGTLADALREIHKKIGDGVALTTGTDMAYAREFASIPTPGGDQPR